MPSCVLKFSLLDDKSIASLRIYSEGLLSRILTPTEVESFIIIIIILLGVRVSMDRDYGLWFDEGYSLKMYCNSPLRLKVKRKTCIKSLPFNLC